MTSTGCFDTDGYRLQVYLGSIHGDPAAALQHFDDSIRDLEVGYCLHGFPSDLPAQYEKLALPLVQRGREVGGSFGLDGPNWSGTKKGEAMAELLNLPHCAFFGADAEGKY